jgi:hypothetical protein
MSCGYLAASFCAIMGDILAARWQNTVLCVLFWRLARQNTREERHAKAGDRR